MEIPTDIGVRKLTSHQSECKDINDFLICSNFQHTIEMGGEKEEDYNLNVSNAHCHSSKHQVLHHESILFDFLIVGC